MSLLSVVTRICKIEESFAKNVPSKFGKPCMVRSNCIVDSVSGEQYVVETSLFLQQIGDEGNLSKCTSAICDSIPFLKRASRQDLLKLSKRQVGENPLIACFPKNVDKKDMVYLLDPLIKQKKSIDSKIPQTVLPLLEYCVGDECLLCGAILEKQQQQTLPSSKIIQAHMQTHVHLGFYLCHCCGMLFPKAESLYCHSKTKLIFTSYKCPRCNSEFSRKHFMDKHCEENTCEPSEKFFSSKLKLQTSFRCIECGKHYTSFSSVAHHAGTQHNSLFQCCICMKTFKPESVAGHSHSHVKPHSCGVCKKRFFSADGLQKHRRAVHAKNILHNCKLCRKQYYVRSNLAEHMQLSHGVD